MRTIALREPGETGTCGYQPRLLPRPANAPASLMSFALGGILCAALIAAPAADETPLDALARLATYLSENDASSAMSMFDSQMKGYGELESNVEAVAAQTDVTCAIDVVSDVESGGVHKLDLDWIVNLTSKTDKSLTERRRE